MNFKHSPTSCAIFSTGPWATHVVLGIYMQGRGLQTGKLDSWLEPWPLVGPLGTTKKLVQLNAIWNSMTLQ